MHQQLCLALSVCGGACTCVLHHDRELVELSESFSSASMKNLKTLRGELECTL